MPDIPQEDYNYIEPEDVTVEPEKIKSELKSLDSVKSPNFNEKNETRKENDVAMRTILHDSSTKLGKFSMMESLNFYVIH